MPRDEKGHIQIVDNIRIRPEKYPMKPNETYNPRHHGQHYHIDSKIDPEKSWLEGKKILKWKSLLIIHLDQEQVFCQKKLFQGPHNEKKTCH